MEHKKGFYEKYIKRPQDFLCSLLACIVLSPIMLVIAILVKIKIGSPVLFAQERPGLHGEIFKLYKFRTMTNESGEMGSYCRMNSALHLLENCFVLRRWMNCRNWGPFCSDGWRFADPGRFCLNIFPSTMSIRLDGMRSDRALPGWHR